jgi:hypothetical protein
MFLGFNHSNIRKTVDNLIDTNKIIINKKENNENIIYNNDFFLEYINISEPILRFISEILDKDRDNVCLAGGAALIFFNEKHKMNSEIINDYDLFIHSCSLDKAKSIIKSFITKIFNVDKTSCDFRIRIKYPIINFGENVCTIYLTNTTKIQFILRLYSSPSEIIHGFDVDSSCILRTFDNKFYATERFLYSYINQQNTLNFTRLSPSYEYRLYKYFKRGYDIYIPCCKYLKDNINFDFHQDENQIKGGKIINFLLINRFNHNYQDNLDQISDYDNRFKQYEFFKANKSGEGVYEIFTPGIEFYDISSISYFDFDKLNFLIQDPSKQTSSTFNKLVLENNFNWFPSLHKEEFSTPKFKKELITFTKEEYEDKEPIKFSNLLSIHNKINKNKYKIDLLNDFMDISNNQYIFSGSSVTSNLIDYKIKQSSIYISMIGTDYWKVLSIINNFYPIFITKYLGILIGKEPEFLCWYDVVYDINILMNFINNGVEAILDINFSMKDDIYDNTRFNNFIKYSRHIPIIKVVLKNYTTYQEIIDDANFDFNRVLLVGNNKYVTDDLGMYAINNKLHFSKPYDITYNILKNFSKSGFRFIIDYEEYRKILIDYYCNNQTDFIKYLYPNKSQNEKDIILKELMIKDKFDHFTKHFTKDGVFVNKR